jgi:hypothetical protein
MLEREKTMRNKLLKVKSQLRNLNSLKVKMTKLVRNQKMKSRTKRKRPKRKRN